MARRTMIIIGAGIGGLTAGVYSQMNGFQTKILEMHSTPGGQCTAWKRRDYTFDYCIHNLAGTGKDADLHQIWEELGALKDTPIIDHPELVRVEGTEGETYTVYSDMDKHIAELKRLSPGDSKLIREYARDMRRFAKMDFFGVPIGGLRRTLRVLPNIRRLSKWSKVSLRDYAARFHNDFLKKAFSVTQYGIEETPVAINMVFTGGLSRKDLGWPTGGSLVFSRNIERRYLELGGKIDYGARVVKIIVKNNRAIGVRLEDGSEHFADIITSAADGRSTIFEMLEGKYATDVLRMYYEEWYPDYQDFGLQVSLGVNRDLSGEPHSIALFLKHPLIIEEVARNRLDIEVFSSSTKMAPEGKSVIKVILKSSYRYWNDIAKNNELYKKEKDGVAEKVISVLETRFPGLRSQIEVVDVSTLLTAERFLGSFHGLQAWGARLDMMQVMKEGLSRTLPGLSNFYMVGSWADGMIGLSTAALSGRRLVKRLCKEEGRHFQSVI